MAKLTRKLKAGTLMESLIAMIIIIVSISVSAIIHTNVLDSDKQYFKLKASQLLNQAALNAKHELNFLDAETQNGDWTITKKVEPYGQTVNLFKLSFRATNSNSSTIVERNELILVEE